MLSILNHTDKSLSFFANIFRANVATRSSRQLMCLVFSWVDQGSPVLILWYDAPHPRYEASDSIVRSGSLISTDLPFHLTMFVSHQVNSSLLPGDSLTTVIKTTTFYVSIRSNTEQNHVAHNQYSNITK